MSNGKVLLFATQKGGTGKSTSCLSIAHAMAREFGKKVAVIDSDEQASVVSFYSERRITANEPEMVGYDMSFPEVAKISAANPYRRQLERIKELYDLVLIDTKGEFDQFQHDLLRLSDYVIVPVQASEFDVVPTKLVRDAVEHENKQREANEQIGLTYIVNKANMSANSTKFIARSIREEFGCDVAEPIVPSLDIIPAAAGFGLTLLDVTSNPMSCRAVINKRRIDGEKISLNRENAAEFAKIYISLAKNILEKVGAV